MHVLKSPDRRLATMQNAYRGRPPAPFDIAPRGRTDELGYFNGYWCDVASEYIRLEDWYRNHPNMPPSSNLRAPGVIYQNQNRGGTLDVVEATR